MFEASAEQPTRRRALWIAPLTATGLVALWFKRSDPAVSASDNTAEVSVVEFSDAGDRLQPARVKKIVRPDAEWRKQLTSEQYYVTRHGSTDMAFTGSYYKLHDPGLFRCICCANALFSSDAKYDSGTGWPSFWTPVAEDNIRRHSDRSLLMERVEVRCKRCDAHLGHVFDDGPPPTNLRYCINESALRFIPAGAS